MKYILVIIAFAIAIMAQKGEAGVYVGAQYADMSTNLEGSGNYDGLGGLVGVSISPALAVELCYALATEKNGNLYTDTDIEDYKSLFIVANLANTFLRPYVKVGYTKAIIEVDAGGGKSESDFSWGAGIAFEVTESESINAEWIRLINKSDIDIDVINVSIVHRF